ncbi:MAG TPA: UDP-N-acetylglucosamine 1-carboxyvinyltransferase, partial [Bacillota bacterium]
MQGFLVRGGRALSGSVRVGGAKNAALPLLAGTVLAAGRFRFRRVPDIRDVRVMLEILNLLGAEVAQDPGDDEAGAELVVETTHLERTEIPESLMREMRSSIVLLGPLLARFGAARASYPGGCVIGPRPIDLHLRSLRAMGACIEESGGYIWARADRLRGAEIHLDVPSVGATEQVMMAATLARGRTEI